MLIAVKANKNSEFDFRDVKKCFQIVFWIFECVLQIQGDFSMSFDFKALSLSACLCLNELKKLWLSLFTLFYDFLILIILFYHFSFCSTLFSTFRPRVGIKYRVLAPFISLVSGIWYLIPHVEVSGIWPQILGIRYHKNKSIPYPLNFRHISALFNALKHLVNSNPLANILKPS